MTTTSASGVTYWVTWLPWPIQSCRLPKQNLSVQVHERLMATHHQHPDDGDPAHWCGTLPFSIIKHGQLGNHPSKLRFISWENHQTKWEKIHSQAPKKLTHHPASKPLRPTGLAQFMPMLLWFSARMKWHESSAHCLASSSSNSLHVVASKRALHIKTYLTAYLPSG